MNNRVAVSARPDSRAIGGGAVTDFVRRWGCSSSIVLLDSVCEAFETPGVDGVIAYRRCWGCAIMYGDPVCAPEQMETLVNAFREHCQREKRQIIYVAVSEKFTQWAMCNICWSLVQAADELVINPTLHEDPSDGKKGRMLRKKLNHAQNNRVDVLEYTGGDPELEMAMEAMTSDWLKARKGPQIFLSRVNLFEGRECKRWFYATRNNRVVGICLLNRLDALGGWVLYMLMAAADAPQGTSEMLVMTVLATLRQEKCPYFTFGAASASVLGEIQGLGKFSSWATRLVFNGAKGTFNLDGRRTYWSKFQPTSEPLYVLFSRTRIGPSEILGVMRAFNVSLLP